MSRWRFEAIGTRWEIETETELGTSRRASVLALIARFDGEWSRFRPDSGIAALANRAGTIEAPPDARAMLDVYAELSAATSGAVNPLVGESLSALGYDAAYSLVAGEPQPAPARWQEVIRCSEAELIATEPVLIDVGAVGKGRLIDLVLTELADVPGDVVVDAGGDLAARGRPIRVALEHPYDPAKAIGVVELYDGAVGASAVNRRAWGEGLHHVLDARTGHPVRSWAATWAFAPEAMRADAIATALFFDGGVELAAHWDVEWVRMSTDGHVQRSAGCPADLFLVPPRSRPVAAQDEEE